MHAIFRYTRNKLLRQTSKIDRWCKKKETRKYITEKTENNIKNIKIIFFTRKNIKRKTKKE